MVVPVVVPVAVDVTAPFSVAVVPVVPGVPLVPVVPVIDGRGRSNTMAPAARCLGAGGQGEVDPPAGKCRAMNPGGERRKADTDGSCVKSCFKLAAGTGSAGVDAIPSRFQKSGRTSTEYTASDLLRKTPAIYYSSLQRFATQDTSLGI